MVIFGPNLFLAGGHRVYLVLFIVVGDIFAPLVGVKRLFFPVYERINRWVWGWVNGWRDSTWVGGQSKGDDRWMGGWCFVRVQGLYEGGLVDYLPKGCRH